MADLLSKVVSKACHDMASILTALDFGVDSLPRSDISLDLRSSVDKGNIAVVFFRGFFVNPTLESLIRFIKYLEKKIKIQIHVGLETLNPKFVFGALYICYQSEANAIQIKQHAVSIDKGRINKDSIILKCLIDEFPFIEVLEKEIINP